MLFYLLHSLYPEFKDNHGKRNSQIFLFGVVLYAIAFILLSNLHIYGFFGKLWDSIIPACIVITVADIAVMFYTYKSFFGRSIVNEIKDNDEHWDYDPTIHKYSKKHNEEPPKETKQPEEPHEQPQPEEPESEHEHEHEHEQNEHQSSEP
jgi:hypothetical protein